MIKRMILILTMIFTLSPGLAFAIDLTPVASDYLVNGPMKMVFGDGDLSASSPLSAVSGVFLAAALMVGGIIALYSMLGGIAMTAHDGELLGKKWSSLWLPVKTSLGTAMLLPVNGGWCLVQMIVFKLAICGIGIADGTWTAFVTSGTLTNNLVYTSKSITTNLQPVFDAMIKDNVKLIAAQKQYDEMKAANPGLGITLQDMLKYMAAKGDLKFKYTAETKNNDYRIYYGTEQIPFGKGMFGDIGYDLSTSSLPQMSKISLELAHPLIEIRKIEPQMKQLHVNETEILNQKAYIIAQLIVGAKTDDISEYYWAALNTYNDNINKGAKPIFLSSVNVNNAATMIKDGWISAWAWYLPISYAQATMQSAISNIPYANEGTFNSMKSYVVSYFSNLAPFTEKADRMIAMAKNAPAVDSNGNSVSAKGGDDLWNRALSTGTKKNLSFFFVGDEGDDILMNPIARMTAQANYLEGVVNDVIIGLTASSVLSAIPIAGNVVQTAATIIAPLLGYLLTALLVPSMIMKYLIPLMPLIVGIGIITGYLMLLVKALFGSVLWAVTFLSPDQDGFVGKQGQGYMLILELVMRPALSVIGLVASLALMVPCSMLFMYMFQFASFGANGGLGGFTQMIAYSIICAIVNYHLFKNLLGLSHTLPDETFSWIGGSSNSELGKYAGGIESASRQGATAILGVGAGAGNAIAGMSNRFQQSKMSQRDKSKKTPENRNGLDIRKK